MDCRCFSLNLIMKIQVAQYLSASLFSDPFYEFRSYATERTMVGRYDRKNRNGSFLLELNFSTKAPMLPFQLEIYRLITPLAPSFATLFSTFPCVESMWNSPASARIRSRPGRSSAPHINLLVKLSLWWTPMTKMKVVYCSSLSTE